MISLEDFKNKSVLILGIGKEGTSTLRYIRKNFPEKLIGLADQKRLNQLDKDIRDIIKKDKKLKLYLGSNYQRDLNKFDVIFKSPGLQVTKPTTAQIMSQTQVFLGLFRDKIIGVTGTKGKTTTSSLIYKILKDANIKVHLVGNVGNPPFDYMEKIVKTDIFVYELSSFQLQDLKVSPHISVFLNLFNEHLDYHGDFENYQKAKTNIFKWHEKGDYLIYNADSVPLVKIIEKADSTKIPFSIEKKLKTGAYVDGEWAFFNQEKILKIADTKLKGKFNLNNILASVSVAKILNIRETSIASSVKSFQPIKHRLEHIGRFQGIDFYNDSIATIPEATIAALETLGPNVATLIVGGYDRGVDYSQLSNKISEEKIPNLILFPQTGKIILDGIKKQTGYQPKYFFAKNMKEAIKITAQVTQKGKICLLSPASSSFNLFKNYQDRGEQFAREVKRLK